MENYISGDQIKIYFADGSQVTAQVISEDDKGNLECSALSKNEVYKEGDTVFVDKSNSKIEKLNFKKKSFKFEKGEKVKVKLNYDTDGETGITIGEIITPSSGNSQLVKYRVQGEEVVKYKNLNELKKDDLSNAPSYIRDTWKNIDNSYAIKKKARTFNWEFDKHKPQWKLNKESMEIERDEDAVKKIAKIRKKLSVNSVIKVSHKLDKSLVRVLNQYSEALNEFTQKYQETDDVEYLNSLAHIGKWIYERMTSEYNKHFKTRVENT